MATFLQLRTRVYDVLRDSGATFVTNTMVNSWINEAYLDVNARLGLLKKTTTDTFSATGTDTLPTDFIRITQLWVDTDTTGIKDKIDIVDDERFTSWRYSGQVPSTLIARIHNNTIETWPSETTKNRGYTMEYIYKPAALSADGDIPALPEELHVKLQHYGRAMGYLVENDVENADIYWTLYNEALPAAPSAQYRENPGPFRFIPETSYWDDV